jgi:hypothetical protein
MLQVVICTGCCVITVAVLLSSLNAIYKDKTRLLAAFLHTTVTATHDKKSPKES